MGTAVSIGVGTAISDRVSQGTMIKMVRDATVQMVTQPEVTPMITSGLKKSDKIRSSIAKFMATAIQQVAKTSRILQKWKARGTRDVTFTTVIRYIGIGLFKGDKKFKAWSSKKEWSGEATVNLAKLSRLRQSIRRVSRDEYVWSDQRSPVWQDGKGMMPTCSLL